MEGFNVIMILLDGLRADRVDLCPNLIKILKKGYYFPHMITSAPYTLASLYSIFSGLYPIKNGVDSYFNMFKFRKDICKTLAEYLQENGYYVVAGLPIKEILPEKGFSEILIHEENKFNLKEIHKNIITNLKHRKFFLFIRYENIHTSVIKTVGNKYTDFSKEYFDSYEINKKNYNYSLEKMDLYIKEIFEHILSLGILKNTIVVIFSDHGISNGEKIGEKMYGSFVYDYTVRVFCSFIIPNSNGREIPFQTRTIDIMPTILDILKIEIDDSYEHLQGKSLMPLIKGEENEDRIAFSETGGLNGPWPSHYEHNVFCVRLPKWKLIYNKTPNTYEMYDLEKDPEEKSNIADKNKELAEELKSVLLSHIENNQKSNV